MDTKIAISLTALTEILKKSELFLEDTSIALGNVNRAVYNAEVLGWNDSSYSKFKDDFDNLQKNIKDSLRDFEETLIPGIKKKIEYLKDFS